MTLDQLEVFIAIANEGGLRAASKVLHKTQPTLSVAIKNLEEELGITLLDRDAYRVKLTSQGEAIYKKASEIKSHIEQLNVMAKEMRMGRETKLSLAIDYLCPMDFLLKVISNFKETCVDTELEMDFEILGGAEDKILNKNSNLAITPFITRDSEVEFQKICDIKIIPVISKKIKISKLSDIPQIIVKDSSDSRDSINIANKSERKTWLVSDHMIKKELIINGFGWGHLEETSIKNELKAKSLLELKVNNLETKTMPLYLARSLKKPFGPVTSELWSYIINQFKNI